MTDGPDGVLPARMYWLKQIPASCRGDARPVRRADRHRPLPLREPQPGRRHRASSPTRTTGARRGTIGQVTYEFVRRRGDPPRRPEVGALRPDHQPRTVRTSSRPRPTRRVQGQEHPILILDADEGITADVNVRRALNLAVDKEAIAENTFGGFATVDAGQLLSPSILGYNDALEPLRVRPRRGQAPARGGRRRRRVDPARSASPGAGSRTASCSRRSPATGPRPASTSSSRSSSSAPTSTCSSTGRTGPTRSTCRAPTTCSIPTASSSTYYEAGGIGSSNSDEEMAALIAAGRSELDPDVRQTDLPRGPADRLRRGATSCGSSTTRTSTACPRTSSGRRGSTPSCWSSEMTVVE